MFTVTLPAELFIWHFFQFLIALLHVLVIKSMSYRSETQKLLKNAATTTLALT